MVNVHTVARVLVGILMASCPFCQAVKTGDVQHEGTYSAAVLDRFPVTEGHALVVPKRCVALLTDLEDYELTECWKLATDIARKCGTDGANIGVNIGAAAGQTVPHAHIHVIPRRNGDSPDPRGGVRKVIPEKAAYWD